MKSMVSCSLPDEEPSYDQLLTQFEDEVTCDSTCHPACKRCLDVEHAPEPEKMEEVCGSHHKLVLIMIAGLRFPVWWVQYNASVRKGI